MAKCEFTVPGEPKGKARPRFSRATGTTYTPSTTAEFESRVMYFFKMEYPDWTPSEKAIFVRIIAYYQIPKSAGKKKREDMKRGRVRPKKKPDFDNVAKAVCDSLNGLAYRDDAQIVDAIVHKLYGDEPRVEVIITELEE